MNTGLSRGRENGFYYDFSEKPVERYLGRLAKKIDTIGAYALRSPHSYPVIAGGCRSVFQFALVHHVGELESTIYFSAARELTKEMNLTVSAFNEWLAFRRT